MAKRAKQDRKKVSLHQARPLRLPGRGRGKWTVRADFDAQLPERVLAAFRGKP